MTTNSNPVKQRSRLLNLALIGLAGWAATRIQLDPTQVLQTRYLVNEITIGVVIYLLVGLLFARKPAGFVARIALICLFAGQSAQLYTQAMTNNSIDMTIFSVFVLGAGLCLQGLAVHIMWLLEVLARRLWRRAATPKAQMLERPYGEPCGRTS